MDRPLHLACPSCGTVNRVAEARLGDGPTCGKCHAALMDAHPVALTDATFPTFIARTELPVVVDFWAEWCGPCRVMAPQFEQAAAQMPNVRFAKLETDANPQASLRHRIRSIPTLVLYRNGEEVARRSGALGAPELLRWLREHLAVAH